MCHHTSSKLDLTIVSVAHEKAIPLGFLHLTNTQHHQNTTAAPHPVLPPVGLHKTSLFLLYPVVTL